MVTIVVWCGLFLLITGTFFLVKHLREGKDVPDDDENQHPPNIFGE